MGYPRLLEGVGGCVLGIGTEEAPWLNSMADTLAKEMQGAVDDANRLYAAKAVFSDPRDEFAGKAIDRSDGSLGQTARTDRPDGSWAPVSG